MKLFWNCVLNECQKLLKRKKYFVFLLIEVIICTGAFLIQMAVNRLSDYPVSLLSNMAMSMLTFFIQVYIPLIVFMASCDLFSTEMQDNTIKAMLMRPVSRFKIYMSKVAAVSIFSVVYLVVLFLTTNIFEAISSGRIQNFGTSFGAYFLDIIPLLVLVFMAVLLNQITRSSSLAMFLSILVYILLCVMGIIVPAASGLLFTGYSQWHNIWLGATLPFGAMISKIGLLAGYSLVFACGGYYLFDKKDF